MATIKVRSLTPGTLTYDRVVINSDGDVFGFVVSPYGTALAAIEATEIGDIDKAALSALIAAKQGVIHENNPAFSTAKTDDGTNDDDTADDGVNDGTRYNWSYNGLLYEVDPTP